MRSFSWASRLLPRRRERGERKGRGAHDDAVPLYLPSPLWGRSTAETGA